MGASCQCLPRKPFVFLSCLLLRPKFKANVPVTSLQGTCHRALSHCTGPISITWPPCMFGTLSCPELNIQGQSQMARSPPFEKVGLNFSTNIYCLYVPCIVEEKQIHKISSQRNGNISASAKGPTGRSHFLLCGGNQEGFTRR